MSGPSSLQKLHWIMAEQRRGPEAWRAAWLAAIDRAFAMISFDKPERGTGDDEK